MPILQNHFYHKTITLYTGVFGAVFNDLKILRDNGKVIKVPIAYSAKQRYDVRNTQNPDPVAVQYKMILPRLGFRLTGMRKDNDRITNKMNRIKQPTIDVDSVLTQYNRVPYIFSFELNAKTKTLDDMLQIIEQIVVYFNPAVRVNVVDNPDLSMDSAIHIRLLDTGIDSMFEGTFDSEQALETTMAFELEGWLYMPTDNVKIIRTIDLNYFDLDADGTLIQQDVVE